MPDTRKSRILMWKCGSLESTVCYEFIYLNRSWTGMMSKNPKKTRTQKFIMGVIVACDFCAKPSVTVVFSRKTMEYPTPLLLTLCLLWTLNRIFQFARETTQVEPLLLLRIMFRTRLMQGRRMKQTICNCLKFLYPIWVESWKLLSDCSWHPNL